MPPNTPRLLTIWRLTDGKPGHEKQSLGLARALERLAGARRYDLPVAGRTLRGALPALFDWLRRRFPAGQALPDPDLILAAGHATHLPALAARRARGGRIVVLMRPSLPLGLFDLCLGPEHDRPPRRYSVIATRGVLNTVLPAPTKDPGRGLMLIGGPSPHFRWDSDAVIDQVGKIAASTPQIAWQLTTSRRTPVNFLDKLAARPRPNLEALPHTATPPGWLEARLAECGQAWVTEDSVSMLYEALTADCRVGLLRLPASGSNRLAAGVAKLVDEGWIAPFEAWHPGRLPDAPPVHFNEAERCARLILDGWFARAA